LQLTDALGIPAQQVEAAAFAWLASKCVAREALDLGAITGARHTVVLGAIYPA
jgi:anhydro-N-acetylmuramic acid kinase